MIKPLKFIEAHWGATTLITLVAITVLSLSPLEKLPVDPGMDHAHHLFAYAVLMFPAALRKPAGWPLLMLFFIGWGGAIELLQPYVNRFGDWLDVAANTLGVICGLLAARFIRVD